MTTIKSKIKDFFSFLFLLTKKWILWLFLVLDLIAVVAQLAIPSLSISHSLFFVIATIGIIWAAYLVYKDLFSKVPLSRASRPPEVSCYFVSGNEYSYEFMKWSDNKIGNPNKDSQKGSSTTIPWAHIYLNVTMQNTGDTSVNLLSINGSVDFNSPFQFMVPEGISSDYQPFSYPIELKPGNTMQIVINDPIQPYSLLTDAQIAARIRPLKIKRESTPFSVSIEYADQAGKLYIKTISTEVSLVPLCDLFISHWNSLGRKDLIGLSTGNNS